MLSLPLFECNSRLHAGCMQAFLSFMRICDHDTDQYFSNREPPRVQHCVPSANPYLPLPSPVSILSISEVRLLSPGVQIYVQITSTSLCHRGSFKTCTSTSSSVLGGQSVGYYQFRPRRQRLVCDGPPTAHDRFTGSHQALTWINRARFYNTYGASNSFSVPYQAQPTRTAPSHPPLTHRTDLELLQPYHKSSWGAQPCRCA
jgi:hypothetical protein